MISCREQCTCRPWLVKVVLSNQGLKTLIFDLDETLIHCLDENDLKTGQGKIPSSKTRRPFDAEVSVKYGKNEMLKASIYIRPGVRECLQKLKEVYEIVVFTASHLCYANSILQLIDPDNELITYRLYRDSCYKTHDEVHIKDLRIIANRNEKDLILVDNSAYSYGFQPHNGVPIIPYYDDMGDRQLFELTEFLLSIYDVADVRPVIQQAFRLDLVMNNIHQFDVMQQVLLKTLCQT